MSLAASLGKQVGPMPLGAWLLVGAGGLFIAYKSRSGDDAPAPEGDALPQAGGAGPIQSWDGAPVILSPIFQVPPNTSSPSVPAPAPVKPSPITKPPVTPRVPVAPKPAAKPKPAPVPKTVTINYTVVKGDTLWGIARRHLGNPLRWKSIYSANKAAIEAAAKRHGYRSSAGGNLIFPGTVLRITK